MKKNLVFGTAIEAAKDGKRITRSEWGNPDIFVFMQVPSTIGSSIVPKMQSLPQMVKDEFVRRFNNPTYQIDAIYYSDQLAIVNSSNLITGYAPCASDVIAEDWEILD